MDDKLLAIMFTSVMEAHQALENQGISDEIYGKYFRNFMKNAENLINRTKEALEGEVMTTRPNGIDELRAGLNKLLAQSGTYFTDYEFNLFVGRMLERWPGILADSEKKESDIACIPNADKIYAIPANEIDAWKDVLTRLSVLEQWADFIEPKIDSIRMDNGYRYLCDSDPLNPRRKKP